MVTSNVGSERTTTHRRIEPSVGVAVAVVLAYMVVVNAIQVTAGIDYQDWFDTAHNAVRTAVIPLAVANVLLLGFVAWARWDIFWRDPERLPMSGLAKAILALFGLTVLARLAWLDWADVPGDLLLALLATGVLVGLAEELVFRGVVLRCLRTGNRPESWAALWTALGFGLFHLPNVFMGTGLAGLSQIVLAATHRVRALPVPPLARPAVDGDGRPRSLGHRRLPLRQLRRRRPRPGPGPGDEPAGRGGLRGGTGPVPAPRP